MAENARETLSFQDAQKVARLSRLALDDGAIREQQTRLAAVLEYVDRLQALDLEGVEPLTNPADEINATRSDEPAPGLETSVLDEMAPESFGSFVRVPKVLGDGGGA